MKAYYSPLVFMKVKSDNIFEMLEKHEGETGLWLCRSLEFVRQPYGEI